MYEENVNMLVKPIIRIALETLPAIDPTPVNPRDRAGQNQLGRAIAALGDNTDSDTKTGYQDSAKIMRIHVYDANSSMSPPADLVNNMMADLSIEVGGESVDDASNNSDQSFFEKIVDLSRNGKRENPTLVKLEDVTTQDLKAYVKRQFPSITYGSANSVVTDVSISSTTTDKVAQAFAYQFENERRGARTTTGPSRVDTGVTVFPANISVEMLGMPFVSMGNQIYLDLGTNTDLDNVYAVYNVTHTIQAGKFVSKIDMKLSNQGMARNVRGDIVKAAKRMVAAKG
jgi:SHS2 domain-containing protein